MFSIFLIENSELSYLETYIGSPFLRKSNKIGSFNKAVGDGKTLPYIIHKKWVRQAETSLTRKSEN